MIKKCNDPTVEYSPVVFILLYDTMNTEASFVVYVANVNARKPAAMTQLPFLEYALRVNCATLARQNDNKLLVSA